MANNKLFSGAILKRLLSTALVLAVLMCSCFAFTVGATASVPEAVGNDVSTGQVGSVKVTRSAFSPTFGQTVYLKPNTTYTFSYKYSTDIADGVCFKYYTSDTDGTAYTKTGPVYDAYYNMVTYTFTTVSLDTEGVTTDDSKELIKSYVGITSYYDTSATMNDSHPKYEMYDFVFGDFQLLENTNGENLLADPLITSLQTAVNQTEAEATWGAMNRTSAAYVASYSYARYYLSENTYPTRDFFVSGPKDEAVRIKAIDGTGPYLVQRIWLKPSTTYVFSYYYNNKKASKFVYFNANKEGDACSSVKESYDSIWKKVSYEFTTVGTNDANAEYNADKTLVNSVIGIRNYTSSMTAGSYFAGFDLYEASDDLKTNLLTDPKLRSIGQFNNGNKWASWWKGTWTNNYYERASYDHDLTNDDFKLVNEIAIGTCTNGSVTTSATTVTDGQTVTLNVVPNEGYRLLELNASGKPVPCVNGEYRFVFSNYYSDPSTGGKVNITAKFVKEDTIPSITHTTHALDKAIAQAVWLEPDTEYIFSYKYNAEPASDIRAGYVKASNSNAKIDLITTKIDPDDFVYKTESYKFTTPKLTDTDVTVGSGQNEGLVKCAVGLFFGKAYSGSAPQGERLFGDLTCYKAEDPYKTNMFVDRDFAQLSSQNQYSPWWKSYYNGTELYMICTKYDADTAVDGKQDPSADLFKNTVVSGDCNGDNEVNLLDMIRLKKYLADKATEIVSVNADMTGDNTLDSNDLVELRKLLLKIK